MQYNWFRTKILEYEDLFEEVIDRENDEDEDLYLETLFLDDVFSNMIEIINMSNKLLEVISFEWSRTNQFESLSPKSSNSSSSYSLIDEKYLDFILITKQPTIEYFKDVYAILQASYFAINITLENQQLGEDKEYNTNDKNWIPIPYQLEEGSHILVEENFIFYLTDDPSDPKTIQLGKSLTKNER